MSENMNLQYPKLKPFVELESDASPNAQILEKSFQNLAGHLNSRTTEGTLYVELRDEETVIYTVDLKDGEAVVENRRPDKADLTLRTNKNTWVEMAAGRISPVEAFVQGNMEIRGNLAFGKRLYAMAAEDKVRDLNI